MAPIGRAAADLLRRSRPPAAGTDAYVCPGTRPGAPLIGLDKPARLLFARAGIESADIHALRRTFASIAVELGYSELLVAALLGHQKGGVTAGYVIADADPLRLAADRVAAFIAGQLEGRALAPVVPIAESWR